jgi:hypothetical protein
VTNEGLLFARVLERERWKEKREKELQHVYFFLLSHADGEKKEARG